MNILYEHLGQTFEWDSGKSIRNMQKHNVTFETACEVFFDPFVRLVDAGVSEETRDAAIGYAEDSSLLFVVHLIREKERIRIISARYATSTEKRLYEEE